MEISKDLERLEAELHCDIEPLKELFATRGKRIRPRLAFLMLRNNGLEVSDEQITLLAAVELAHLASLIHDDIIDLSLIRRGIPTLNAKYDAQIAVLAGDYVLSLAFKKLLSLRNFEVLDDFIETFATMSAGEIAQGLNKGKKPTLKEYLEKSEAKTAKLFEACLKNSARLAGADINQWGKIGHDFGLAFQIRNDLEDYLGAQNDLKSGIYTAPAIIGADETKKLIESYLEKLDDKIRRIF